jgi:hypothetical protein
MADARRRPGLSRRGRSQLEAEFRATTYRIETGEEPIDLRIGESSSALDALLHRLAAARWAFISAANPGAQATADDINARRHNELLAVLQAAGYLLLPGCGVPAASHWRPEPSWFVIDIRPEDALALARRFRQVALVAGERGSAPQLIWC